MPSLEAIKVYGDFMSPNPCKIRIILEELDIPFHSELVTFEECKKEPYISINPNGRLPAIYDPNTGITLWESGAITTYLVEQYDKHHIFSFDSIPEKYQIHQWIAFQISGQGPYYGQGVWFNLIHPEKLPSAIERYEKEIERVRSVLDTHLKKQSLKKGDGDTSGVWLVGNKCTVADLSWVMWEHIAEFVFQQKGYRLKEEGKYPAYDEWVERLNSRPTCQKAFAGRREGLAQGRLMHAIRDDMKEATESAFKNNSISSGGPSAS